MVVTDNTGKEIFLNPKGLLVLMELSKTQNVKLFSWQCELQHWNECLSAALTIDAGFRRCFVHQNTDCGILYNECYTGFQQILK